MKLHLSKPLFKQAAQATADLMGIRAEYVEKDYWVTFALKRVFASPIGSDVVFKGGTALSKCYNLIERFSEDIDLVVIRRDGEPDSRIKSKLKQVHETVLSDLPEIETPGTTNKLGRIRKTAHDYQKLFEGHYGQAKDVILIESTSLGSYEPFITMNATSFIGNLLANQNQNELLTEFDMHPFEVRVQQPI